MVALENSDALPTGSRRYSRFGNRFGNLRYEAGTLFPFAFALGEAVFAVAIGAHRLAGSVSQDLPVGFVSELSFGMARQTEGIDFCPRIHGIRSRAIASRGPRFIRDVGIGRAMAARATHIDSRMSHHEFLLC